VNRGGTIVDVTEALRYRGEVWIRASKIAQVGGRRHCALPEVRLRGQDVMVAHGIGYHR